ncbi:MAG TPA: hypothetical protein VGG92_00100 [Caulobacteraceae bacterium]|jgi:hypothetical protein
MTNWLGGLDPRWEGASIGKEHWHFHRRLWDRYSIILAPGEFTMILTAIRTGEALLVERRGRGTAVYSFRVPSCGERVYVVAAGHALVTVLPPRPRLNELRRRARRVPASERSRLTDRN